MIEIKETQSVFIAKDGKKFKSKSACERHEEELDRIEYKNKIIGMDSDELNIQITNFLGDINKNIIGKKIEGYSMDNYMIELFLDDGNTITICKEDFEE